MDDVPESAVPVMPQNVFGLNYADIIIRVGENKVSHSFEFSVFFYLGNKRY